MKFSINKTDLVKKLDINNTAVSSNTINDILKGLKISLANNELTIVSSSSDLSIKTNTKADDRNNLKIEEEGEIVIANARYFTEIVKKLSGSIVEIETSNASQLVVTSGSATFEIPVRNSANYPNLPVVDDTKSVILGSLQLLDIIKQTTKSTEKKGARPIFNGIHLVIDSNQIKGVATDSHRLAQKISSIENGQPIDVVVPNRTLNVLASLLENVSSVKLQFDESYLAIDMNDITIYSQLLAGDFPATDRLIPDEYKTKVVVDVKNILPVIARGTLAANQSNNTVITFKVENNQLTISTRQTEQGTFVENVKTNEVTGENIVISMNPDFVKEAIESLGQDIVQFEFVESLKPFVLRPLNAQNNDEIQLITPVRTIDN